MSETRHKLYVPTGGETVEEVLEGHRRHSVAHGNDIDLLNKSMVLIQAGHYREAMRFALQVQPLSSELEEPPDTVDKPTAQAAFLAASERARPLFEQAAREIEGKAEGSHTMFTVDMALDMLRSDPNW